MARTISLSELGNLTETSQYHEGISPGKASTTPPRTAGPSLDQIVAKVTARKQALRDAENAVPGLDGVLIHTLKEHLLVNSRPGLKDVHGVSSGFDVAPCSLITPLRSGHRQALAQLQNITPVTTPANTPRSILKHGSSSSKKSFPSSISWSSDTRLHSLPGPNFCTPSPRRASPPVRLSQREIIYETAQPNYPSHLLRSSHSETHHAGSDRVSPRAPSFTCAEPDLPPASGPDQAYAARYLAGLPPLPSLPPTGTRMHAPNPSSASSSSSSICSIASGVGGARDLTQEGDEDAIRPQTRLRGDAPAFFPRASPARAHAANSAGDRTSESCSYDRASGHVPACNASLRADATC